MNFQYLTEIKNKNKYSKIFNKLQQKSVLGLLGDLNLSESLTETGQTASLERYEFANRLANQHSALGSLGQVQTGIKPEMTGNDPKIQTGTLEG